MSSPAPAQRPHDELLVSCGEPSGDLYAAELVRHLRERARPDRRLRPRRRSAAVAGRATPRARPAIWRSWAWSRCCATCGACARSSARVLAEVDRERRALAVLVDYAGFNLRLAQQLRRRGIPVVYYVSPQLWAWRRGRIRTVRECVERMLVIFPFEEPFYREAGVPRDLRRPPARRAGAARRRIRARSCTAQGLDPDAPGLAVLPGSRRAGGRLQPARRSRGRSASSRSRGPSFSPRSPWRPDWTRRRFDAALEGCPSRSSRGQAHALMGAAAAGIVASGTATVEAALLDLACVVVYRVSPVSYALGRPFVHVPHYAMVNLIAGRRVAHGADPGRLRARGGGARRSGRLLDDPATGASVALRPGRGARRASVDRGRRAAPPRPWRPSLEGSEAKKSLTGQEVVCDLFR